MCLLKFTYRKLVPLVVLLRGGAFEEWLSHEGCALTMGLIL